MGEIDVKLQVTLNDIWKCNGDDRDLERVTLEPRDKKQTGSIKNSLPEGPKNIPQ